MSGHYPKKSGVNIELYMQSGIVESYALGLVTPEEAAEFEQLLPHYPELKDALSDFEYHLELFSIDNEVPPPPEARARIEERLRETPAIRHHTRRGYRQHHSEYLQAKETSHYIRVHKIWRVLFVVVFIVSKIYLALAIYYFLEYRQAKARQLQQPVMQQAPPEGGK